MTPATGAEMAAGTINQGANSASPLPTRAMQRSLRRFRTSMSSLGNPGDDMLQFRIRRSLMAQEIRQQGWILKLKQRFKRATFFFWGARVPPFQVPLQQLVELAHAAPRTPTQTREPEVRPALRLVRAIAQCRRSAIIFLMSAMARAGFKSFGQASVQFMMVWQRYSRNGSSSASSRSPVASSRVSMIQRYAANRAAGPR